MYLKTNLKNGTTKTNIDWVSESAAANIELKKLKKIQIITFRISTKRAIKAINIVFRKSEVPLWLFVLRGGGI